MPRGTRKTMISGHNFGSSINHLQFLTQSDARNCLCLQFVLIFLNKLVVKYFCCNLNFIRTYLPLFTFLDLACRYSLVNNSRSGQI